MGAGSAPASAGTTSIRLVSAPTPSLNLMMSMHMMWPRDPNSVAEAKIDRDAARRIWRFASPYRRLVAGFLVTVVISAILGLVPPLLFGRIIDRAIPEQNRGLLAVFAAAIVAASLLAGIVGLVERYWSSRIGEGVIYDLRVALFDHVQQLPLAFFTRTQTGALTNRLNNDVIGAQRALTTTLGTVVSNVITLVTTLLAMVVLEWRLTLLALLLTTPSSSSPTVASVPSSSPSPESRWTSTPR